MIPDGSVCDITAQFTWENLRSQACTYGHTCKSGMCSGIPYSCPPLQSCEAPLDEFPHVCDMTGPASATGGCRRGKLAAGTVCKPRVDGCQAASVCTGWGTCSISPALFPAIEDDATKALSPVLPGGQPVDPAFGVVPSLDSIRANYTSFRSRCGDLQLHLGLIPDGDCQLERVTPQLGRGWGNDFEPSVRGSFNLLERTTAHPLVLLHSELAGTALLPNQSVAAWNHTADSWVNATIVTMDVQGGDLSVALPPNFPDIGVADPLLDLDVRREHAAQLYEVQLVDVHGVEVSFRFPPLRTEREWTTVIGTPRGVPALSSFDWHAMRGARFFRSGPEELAGVPVGTPLLAVRAVRLRTRAEAAPCDISSIAPPSAGDTNVEDPAWHTLTLPLNVTQTLLEIPSRHVVFERWWTPEPVSVMSSYDTTQNAFVDGSYIGLHVQGPQPGFPPLEVELMCADGTSLAIGTSTSTIEHALNEWLFVASKISPGHVSSGVTDTSFQQVVGVRLRYPRAAIPELDSTMHVATLRGLHVGQSSGCAHSQASALFGQRDLFAASSTSDAAGGLQLEAAAVGHMAALHRVGSASTFVDSSAFDIDLTSFYNADCGCFPNTVLEMAVTPPTPDMRLTKLSIVETSTGGGVEITLPSPEPRTPFSNNEGGIVRVLLDDAVSITPPSSWGSLNSMMFERLTPVPDTPGAFGEFVVHFIRLRRLEVPCVSSTALASADFVPSPGVPISDHNAVVFGVTDTATGEAMSVERQATRFGNLTTPTSNILGLWRHTGIVHAIATSPVPASKGTTVVTAESTVPLGGHSHVNLSQATSAVVARDSRSGSVSWTHTFVPGVTLFDVASVSSRLNASSTLSDAPFVESAERRLLVASSSLDQTSMWSAPVDTSAMHVRRRLLASEGPGTCPPGWTSATSDPTRCFHVMADTPRTYLEASRACKELGGALAAITSNEDKGLTWSLGQGKSMWTGALRMGNLTFVWPNGEIVGAAFPNWHPNTDIEDVEANCVEIGVAALWLNVDCSFKRFALCEQQTWYHSSCPPGWLPHDGQCLIISSTERLFWSDASRQCQRVFSATLVAPVGSSTSFALRAVASKATRSPFWDGVFWLGAVLSPNSSDFSWLTESELRRDPSKTELDIMNSECVAMDAPTGRWLTFACDTPLHFACSMPDACSALLENPCLHGGHCQSKGDGRWQCVCPLGWSGGRCQRRCQPGYDSDGDKVWDCDDPCPNDKTKWEYIDTDGDGVPDCEDECPFSATAIDKVDVDGDGVTECGLCQYGWTHSVDSPHMCLRAFSSPSSMTFHTARAVCQEVGADLASISSEAAQAQALQVVSSIGPALTTWIGLSQSPGTTAWTWIDGRLPTFAGWGSGAPKNFTHNCGWLTALDGWQSVECTAHTNMTLCEQRAAPTCAPGWRRMGDACVIMVNERNSWESARLECRLRGGAALVTPRTWEDVHQLAVISGGNGVWIGQTSHVGTGPRMWMDGSFVNHTFWDSGHPVTNGSAVCVEQVRTVWRTVDCTHHRSYVCALPDSCAAHNPCPNYTQCHSSPTGPLCCSLDSDGDGVFDCDDECPYDPTRSSDVDSDGDGVPNCQDDCPWDQTTVTGTDADDNGTFDCNECFVVSRNGLKPRCLKVHRVHATQAQASKNCVQSGGRLWHPLTAEEDVIGVSFVQNATGSQTDGFVWLAAVPGEGGNIWRWEDTQFVVNATVWEGGHPEVSLGRCSAVVWHSGDTNGAKRMSKNCSSMAPYVCQYEPSDPCPAPFVATGTHCSTVTSVGTFEHAQAECDALDSYLAHIHNPEDAAHVHAVSPALLGLIDNPPDPDPFYTLSPAHKSVWIGLSRSILHEPWTWVDDESQQPDFLWGMWDSGFPLWHVGTRCVMQVGTDSSGPAWRNFPCAYPYLPGVCQIPNQCATPAGALWCMNNATCRVPHPSTGASSEVRTPLCDCEPGFCGVRCQHECEMGVDSDGDGVLDCFDDCPWDSSLSRDSDSDGDGTVDCMDQCPFDVNKVVDDDLDGDGHADCLKCPSGWDSDGDGVLDCLDVFPFDPTRSTGVIKVCTAWDRRFSCGLSDVGQQGFNDGTCFRERTFEGCVIVHNMAASSYEEAERLCARDHAVVARYEYSWDPENWHLITNTTGPVLLGNRLTGAGYSPSFYELEPSMFDFPWEAKQYPDGKRCLAILHNQSVVPYDCNAPAKYVCQRTYEECSFPCQTGRCVSWPYPRCVCNHGFSGRFCQFACNATDDTDGDGVNDCWDDCPHDPNVTSAPDADGDGYPDCRDTCPNDYLESESDYCAQDHNPGRFASNIACPSGWRFQEVPSFYSNDRLFVCQRYLRQLLTYDEAVDACNELGAEIYNGDMRSFDLGVTWEAWNGKLLTPYQASGSTAYDCFSGTFLQRQPCEKFEAVCQKPMPNFYKHGWCAPGWTLWDSDQCVRVVTDAPLSWQAARTYCQQSFEGGDMFVPYTEQHLRFARAQSPSSAIWVGLRQRVAGASFAGIDGTSPGFESWASLQPASSTEPLCAVQLPGQLLWNATNCHDTRAAFVCAINVHKRYPATGFSRSPWEGSCPAFSHYFGTSALEDDDGDTVENCKDACPGDPAKVTDVDSDRDGTPDCVDACPHNPRVTRYRYDRRVYRSSVDCNVNSYCVPASNNTDKCWVSMGYGQYAPARETCAVLGGTLPVPESTTELRQLADMASGSVAWLGIQRLGDTWVWDDGSMAHLSFSQWQLGSPSASGDCAVVDTVLYSMKNVDCAKSELTFCELRTQTYDTCPMGWVAVRDRCVRLFDTPVRTWTGAQEACRSLSAHLLSVHNETEAAWLWAVSRGQPVFIGLTDASSEGVFEWEDGTEVDFDPLWARDSAGFDSQPDNTNGQDCVVVQPELGWYSWDDTYCDGQAFAYACAFANNCAGQENPCLNGGRCSSQPNGNVTCVCPTGTAGALCEDACASDDSKLEPGVCGCGVPDIDTDGDSVLDCDDGCPLDILKVSDVDTDGDGVLDCNDQCPSNSSITIEAVDSDGDGVFDCNDLCPSDASRINDADTDGDGVLDCNDECPHNATLTRDADDDGDGAPNCMDECPQHAHKTSPGVCGCGTPDSTHSLSDSDGDSVVNCLDLCPFDTSKSEPGVCGCGVSDLDADADGVPSCNSQLDECDLNPTKVTIGVCGCDGNETDTDGDTFMDCIDECPFDPYKVIAGACGCGNAEASCGLQPAVLAVGAIESVPGTSSRLENGEARGLLALFHPGTGTSIVSSAPLPGMNLSAWLCVSTGDSIAGSDSSTNLVVLGGYTLNASTQHGVVAVYSNVDALIFENESPATLIVRSRPGATVSVVAVAVMTGRTGHFASTLVFDVTSETWSDTATTLRLTASELPSGSEVWRTTFARNVTLASLVRHSMLAVYPARKIVIGCTNARRNEFDDTVATIHQVDATTGHVNWRTVIHGAECTAVSAVSDSEDMGTVIVAALSAQVVTTGDGVSHTVHNLPIACRNSVVIRLAVTTGEWKDSKAAFGLPTLNGATCGVGSPTAAAVVGDMIPDPTSGGTEVLLAGSASGELHSRVSLFPMVPQQSVTQRNITTVPRGFVARVRTGASIHATTASLFYRGGAAGDEWGEDAALMPNAVAIVGTVSSRVNATAVVGDTYVPPSSSDASVGALRFVATKTRIPFGAMVMGPSWGITGDASISCVDAYGHEHVLIGGQFLGTQTGYVVVRLFVLLVFNLESHTQVSLQIIDCCRRSACASNIWRLR